MSNTWEEVHDNIHVQRNHGDERNLFTALIVTILFGAIFFVTLQKLNLSGNSLIILLALEGAFFFSIMLMLLEPKLFKRATKIIEKPVYLDRVVDRIVEKPIEVIKEIEIPVVKEIQVPYKPKKLNIPKYDFIGSSETKTYHKRNCRLGKMIKKKYKVSNNSASFFRNRRYSACKVCIQKTKKV